MNRYDFGSTVRAIQELEKALEENNRLTSEQNEKMLKYTWWLIALTIIIAVLTFVMVCDVIFRIVRF